MNHTTVEIDIPEEIHSILERYHVVVRDSNVTFSHPNFGMTTCSPTVYAVYLTAIKANYTMVFLTEISSRPIEAMAACGYFASMIADSDDLPWFDDNDVSNASEIINQANIDFLNCSSFLAKSGLYHLLD